MTKKLVLAVHCDGEAKQWENNKAAFLKARSAATAETWTAALLSLKSIDLAKVDDLEVIAYIDFSIRCASLADEFGVDRKSDPFNTKKTLIETDKFRVISKVFSFFKLKGFSAAIRDIGDLRRIQKQVPWYQELDEKLTQKYGACLFADV